MQFLTSSDMKKEEKHQILAAEKLEVGNVCYFLKKSH